MSQDQHYQTHVFVCVNERAPDHPRSCCSARGSVELRAYMKDRAKELNIPDIRVNNAGCLERCELGPNLVIYPEGIWYQFQTRDDVDEALDSVIVKSVALAAPAEAWLRHGVEHPLGADFSGVQDLVPQTIDEQTALEYTARVPASLMKEICFHGTADEVLDQVAGMVAAGYMEKMKAEE